MKASPWPAITLFVFVFVLARPALAESSVTVLGIRSLDGEAALELRASQALRSSASTIAAFRVSDNDVSLAQMSLAHGCEEPNVACLSAIAETLSSDRLIFGTLVRTSAGLQLTLYSFDARRAEVDGTLSETLDREQLARPNIDGTMTNLIKRLAGQEEPGTLSVSGDEPGAAVFIDGKRSGTLDSQGTFVSHAVSPGHHTVTLESFDAERRESLEASVRPNETTSIQIALRPPPPAATTQPAARDASWEEPPDSPGEKRSRHSVRRGVGFGMLGLAALSAAATGYAWIRLGRIANDDDMQAYRREFPPPGQPNGVNDVCAKAEAGALADDPEKAGLESTARSLCRETRSLETLQYVFLGSALLTATIGTILLLKKPKRSKDLAVVPAFGRRGAWLSASLRF